jgi:copper ion binding protein
MGLLGSKNRTTIKVEGMTCNHCVMRVAKALEAVDGVKKANVSLDKKEAEIVFSGDSVDPDVLIKVLNEAGYKARTT